MTKVTDCYRPTQGPTARLWWAPQPSTRQLCSDFSSKVLQLRQFNLHLCSKGSRNGTTTAVCVCWFVCFGSDWWTVIWQTHTDGQTQWKQSYTRALIASLLKHRRGTNQVWAALLFLPSNGGNKGSWCSSHQLLNRWPDSGWRAFPVSWRRSVSHFYTCWQRMWGSSMLINLIHMPRLLFSSRGWGCFVGDVTEHEFNSFWNLKVTSKIFTERLF